MYTLITFDGSCSSLLIVAKYSLLFISSRSGTDSAFRDSLADFILGLFVRDFPFPFRFSVKAGVGSNGCIRRGKDKFFNGAHGIRFAHYFGQKKGKEVIKMAVQKSMASSSLAEVIDRILDKGIVIDAWARLSLVGIEFLSLEARVVVSGVETYLKYAEAIGLTATAAQPA